MEKKMADFSVEQVQPAQQLLDISEVSMILHSYKNFKRL